VTFNQFCEKFNINLTEQQNRAVQAVSGPTLLLAVPGSGKTTVLVTRLGYMIHCKHIPPESILTMTYTVAAAHDMKARFRQIFGNDLCDKLEFRTINGVCAKIIQNYEYLSGGTAFSLIADEKRISSILSDIYREVTGSFPTESDIKNVRTLITYAKNMMLTESEIKALNRQCPRFSDMYYQYCGELRRRQQMDYDDQIVYAFNILRRYPVILEQIQHKYKYVCVDEAQDTSKIQHSIISLIAQNSGNLFMVGDEDQSIYGFRAAYPEALIQFEKQHKDANVLLMEKNFRSNAKIVAAADRFISKNTHRHAKNMHPSRPEGEEIKEITLKSQIEQYAEIIRMIGQTERETAILYRDNESALPLVDILERKGIPYRIKAGDLTFFTHRVVQDIRNIIQFAADPYNTDIFLQIYYKLTTYLNKTSAAIACDISRQEHISVWDAIFSMEDLSVGALKGCRNVKSQFDKLLLDSANKAINRIYTLMGYREYLDRMSIKPHKITILEAIGANEPSPYRLLQRLDELEEIIRYPDYSADNRLILSTIHSSKGLEYDTVFIIDVCDGIFPETVVHNIQKADKELVRTYEEERRLFYVGVTRARNSLNLFTYSGQSSTFCDEILNKKISFDTSAPKAVTVPTSIIAKSKSENSQEFDEFLLLCQVGSIVTHKFFGTGRIIERDDDIIIAEFSSGRQKKLSISSLFQQNLLKNSS